MVISSNFGFLKGCHNTYNYRRGATTFSLMTLSIMTLRQKTPGVMRVSSMTLRIMTLSLMTLGVMSVSPMTLSKMTFRLITNTH
jgi:hypothetical protein